MGCFKFLKAMMFIFNGIIFLAGAAVLGVGIWVKVDGNSLLTFLSGIPGAPAELNLVQNVGYVLIALGAILLLVGFLGCYGAAKESKCVLMLFFIIVLIIFIAEVAAGIVILAFRNLFDDLLNTIGREVVESIQKGFGIDTDLTGLLNTSMIALNCCGFYGYADFADSNYVNATLTYPRPCCGGAPCIEQEAQDLAVPGCLSRVGQLIKDNAEVLGGVALGIACLEVGAMTVAMILYCKIKKERQEVE